MKQRLIKALQIGIGMAIGILLYDGFTHGIGNLDPFRAIFVGCLCAAVELWWSLLARKKTVTQ